MNDVWCIYVKLPAFYYTPTMNGCEVNLVHCTIK